MSFELLHPRPQHFQQIQELCLKVYPFSKPWSIAQLESHQFHFPDGQLIIVDTEKNQVVGLAFSLIISWDDYSQRDNWGDFTAGGFFSNHNPRKGKTLYGAEVMVDPECRGQGLGKLLYEGRKKIVQKYGLKRIRAGARLRGYSRHKDTMSATEYAGQVVARKIYDPTLSFQLARDFVVIDVAKNYLFNDPESLGHAAVIEWLNPDLATPSDLLTQKRAVEVFLKGDRFIPEHLPRELRHLVRKTTLVLGHTLREMEGDGFFRKVETYRQRLKRTRNEKDKALLMPILLETQKEDAATKQKLAHAFALHMELVNCCEAAYRTWRIRQRTTPRAQKKRLPITLVLTAHPTEARSSETLVWLSRLTDILLVGLNNQFLFDDLELSSLIRLLWSRPLTKAQSPTVADEADYILSLALSDKSFDFLLSEQQNFDLHLRTWVGGDKDGHPGVDRQVMLACLQKSRIRLLAVLDQCLTNLLLDGDRLEDLKAMDRAAIGRLRVLQKDLKNFKVVSAGDGNRLKAWKLNLSMSQRKCSPILARHHETLRINRLLTLFPALVLPIELREDAAQIAVARKEKLAPIRQMLVELAKIAGALDIRFYAGGMVISHCESMTDLDETVQLIAESTQQSSLPAIPLFESGEALRKGSAILRKWLKTPKNQEIARRKWNSSIEVMLGYSDSAKQIGVLSSRNLIAKTMMDLERTIKSFRLKPIFFHGSGGSIARGGGSLEDQISWWSLTAIENPKLTVQGEMIQRWFATPEILNSQCTHLSNEFHRRRLKKLKREKSPALEKLAGQVEESYRQLMNDDEKLPVLLEATPYRYLNLMSIGSRPSKRPAKKASLSDLRAIPWVLCWTQCRLLLPTWWGVGSAWQSLSPDEQQALTRQFKEDPFFASFVKALGFSLAKVEFAIWEIYFEQVSEDQGLSQTLHSELQKALQFVHEVSGEKQLLWYRPWLGESIRLRSPQIHLLNFLQISAMRNANERLLRETLVGIACGMLTTG